MSVAYKKRKKAIRDERRRIGHENLEYGQIPKGVFYVLKSQWKKALEGRPVGSITTILSGPSYRADFVDLP